MYIYVITLFELVYIVPSSSIETDYIISNRHFTSLLDTNITFYITTFQKPSSTDMSHAEASDHLRLVEEALDKVVPGDNGQAKNFTARLIGTITRTVKYVADVSLISSTQIADKAVLQCEKRLVDEGTARVKLESKVNEQHQLINALSHELMNFEKRQTDLMAKFEQLSDNMQK